MQTARYNKSVKENIGPDIKNHKYVKAKTSLVSPTNHQAGSFGFVKNKSNTKNLSSGVS